MKLMFALSALVFVSATSAPFVHADDGAASTTTTPDAAARKKIPGKMQSGSLTVTATGPSAGGTSSERSKTAHDDWQAPTATGPSSGSTASERSKTAHDDWQAPTATGPSSESTASERSKTAHDDWQAPTATGPSAGGTSSERSKTAHDDWQAPTATGPSSGSTASERSKTAHDDWQAPTATGPTGNATPDDEARKHLAGVKYNNLRTSDPQGGGIDPFPDPPNDASRTLKPGRTQFGTAREGHQGIGLGAMTGNSTADGQGPAPQTLQLEYFNVGKNPTESGRAYGLTVDKLEFSGVSNGLPQMALETRGMSGWQLIGAGDKHPVMFHLGVEPLNFETQVTSHIVDDARNTAARIADQKANGGKGGQDGSQIGNPDAPVTRAQFGYYVPSISMGVEVRKAGCRFLALVRGGAAGGGQLRTDQGYSYGVDAAYGAGVYMNCPKVDVDGEWTRIAQSDSPMDLVNVDAMVKPWTNIPLALGLELGSTVTNSQDPKSVPLALPGYGVKGAEVETHAGAVVRLVF